MKRLITISLSLLSGLFAPLVGYAAAPEPAVLAQRIDAILNEQFKSASITVAPLADDATYLRRISLDLIGRIPTPNEVYTFLNDPSPNKRQKWVQKWLQAPGYSNHFAHYWRSLLLPEASANFEMRGLQPGFEAWLQTKLKANAPFNKIAYELITTPIGTAANNNVGMNDPRSNPMAFFTAKESKPENLAAATAKVFLGVQIECAQCHNHPFAKWSREQFWGLAAFYGGLERRGEGNQTPVREVLDRREMSIPNTDRVVQATFLDDKEPEWKFKTSARVTLAEWMTAPDNPWFARALVNRMWGYFLGHGIVDPVDDFNDENKPTHPQILDALTQAFVASNFDLHYIIRVITSTQAYQRSSQISHPSQQDPRLFARMPLRGLTGEQFFDSLALATGTPNNPRCDLNTEPRNSFLEKFALQGKKTDSQTSILQALTLMNGDFVNRSASLGSSQTLSAIAEMPLLSLEDKIDALYLTTLSRKPKTEERDRVQRYLRSAHEGKQNEKLADLMWVLLNSVEFRVNH